MSDLRRLTEGQDPRRTLRNIAAAQEVSQRGQSGAQTSANLQQAAQAAQSAQLQANQQGKSP